MWGSTWSEEKDLYFSNFKEDKFWITYSTFFGYDSQCSSVQNAENSKQHKDLVSLLGFFLWNFVISEQVFITFGGGVGTRWGFAFSHPGNNIASPSSGPVLVVWDCLWQDRLGWETVLWSVCLCVSQDYKIVPFWCCCPKGHL